MGCAVGGLLLYALGQYQANYMNAQKSEADQREESSRAYCYQIATFGPICISDDNAAQAEAERADHDLQAQQDMAEWTGWITLFTGLQLIIGGFGLWGLWRTVKLTNKATRAATKATKAAVRSANIAFSIELPIIGARPPDLLGLTGPLPNAGPFSGVPLTVSPASFCTVVSCNIQNIGRTPALLTGVEIGWHVGDKLPEQPIYTHRADERGGEALNPGVTDHEIDFPRHTISLSTEEIDGIDARTISLWFFAVCRYTDFMNEQHSVHFCWRWSCPDEVGDYYLAADQNTPNSYRTRS